MKKITAIILALIILTAFCSCGVTAEKIQKEEPKTDPAKEEQKVEKNKSYSEMTLEEKLEYKSGLVWDKNPIENTDDSLAPAKSKDSENWGYINAAGKWVLEPTYSFAYPFSYGFAAVLENFEDYIFLDREYNKALTAVNRNTIRAVAHFNDGYAPISLDAGFAQSMIYIGSDLRTQLDASALPKTNGIKYESTSYFMTATPFINGNAVAMRRTNNHLINVSQVSRDTLDANDYYQSAYVIDTWGGVVAQLPKGYDIDNNSLDENGLIIVRNMKTEECLYGLCDLSGNVVVGCKYRRILHAEGDLYACCSSEGFWGYINKDGKTIVSFTLQEALPFSEGYAAVCEDGLWGVINTKGEYVIEPAWDEVCNLYISELDSISADAAVSSGVCALRLGKYWALVDMNGEIVAAKAFETEDAVSPFLRASKNHVVFSDGELCGLMSAIDGSIEVDAKFGNIGIFN